MPVIKWDDVDHFSKDEFSEDPDIFAEPLLIHSMDTLRKLCDCPIFPSPVNGALARANGSQKSRHYAVGRKSDALDFFIIGDFFKTYQTLITCNLFNGIGIYFNGIFDGKQHVRYHADLRPTGLNSLEPLIWFMRDKDHGCKYPQLNAVDMEEFKQCLIIEMKR